MARTPAYYIPHGGGPCFFMDWTPPDTWTALAHWLSSFPAGFATPPSALLVISAHWEEPVFTLGVKPDPELYYDYYDFPPHTYELTWPAPAAPQLFPKIQSLLKNSGIAFALDQARDFDHGVFVPGKLSFPDAAIPTMQISLKRGLDPAAHIALGKALAPLRDEGVFILGSGMSYHNMRAFRYRDNNPIPGAEIFDDWLTETVREKDRRKREQRLAQWESAPGARAAHPREEHLLPLMVVAGTAGEDAGELAFHCRAMGAPLSAYSFS